MKFTRKLRPSFGRTKHKLLRYLDGTTYVRGEPIDTPPKEVVIRANIQPVLQQHRLMLLPQGTREKETINISSIDYVYTDNSGAGLLKSKKADIIIYKGVQWKVVWSIPCENHGTHCEAMAVLLPEQETQRFEGEVIYYDRVGEVDDN